MLCLPLVGIGITISLYLYMKVIYRRIVKEINSDECMDYLDLGGFNQQLKVDDKTVFLHYPVYIDKSLEKADETKLSKINLHKYYI